MSWGSEGKIDEKRLSKLGLICWGGSSNKNGVMTYHVYNENKTYDVYLIQKDFDNVDKHYKKYMKEQRKLKLIKIGDDKD